MNGPGKFHLFVGEVFIFVLRELVGKDQQTVQGRPQLVRHVGQELGLVFGSQGELFGLLFQRLPGQFDFAILSLHFHVLVSQQLGFFSQLLVGLLQLLLLALELLGQRLGLLEEVLSAHVGFNGIEHDADAFGQLIQERLVGGAEFVERGQFHHRLDLPFEYHRQHDDIQRCRLTQTGADRQVVSGHAREHNFFFFESALSDQSLTQFESIVHVLALAIGVTGQQL